MCGSIVGYACCRPQHIAPGGTDGVEEAGGILTVEIYRLGRIDNVDRLEVKPLENLKVLISAVLYEKFRIFQNLAPIELSP